MRGKSMVMAMRRTYKKILCALTAFLLFLTLAAGCGKKNQNEESGGGGDSSVKINIAALKGPTGIGMVKLWDQVQKKTAKGNYEIKFVGTPDEITGDLIKGDLQIAALPTNAAAVLYNKTGKIQLAALNTLGVLYILEKGETIQTVSDLDGRTIYATGQGATPEYVLDYILKANHVTADVSYEKGSEHAELVAQALAGQADVVMLPEPFVTTLLSKSGEYRIALNLTEAFEQACAGQDKAGTVLTMGCIVVNKEFAQQHPEAVNQFLDAYKASAEYAAANLDETAELTAQYGIMASAEAAKRAIPNCNIVYIDGTEMKDKIGGFFGVLYDYNAGSIGGRIPDENFYYGR